MKSSYLTTARWKNRTQLYHDRKRLRFVVHRRCGAVVKRTSIRYAENGRSEKEARRIAEAKADRLKEFPGWKLQEFQFNP